MKEIEVSKSCGTLKRFSVSAVLGLGQPWPSEGRPVVTASPIVYVFCLPVTAVNWEVSVLAQSWDGLASVLLLLSQAVFFSFPSPRTALSVGVEVGRDMKQWFALHCLATAWHSFLFSFLFASLPLAPLILLSFPTLCLWEPLSVSAFDFLWRCGSVLQQ